MTKDIERRRAQDRVRSARYRANHPGRHAENQARYRATTKGILTDARAELTAAIQRKESLEA
jgi:hypothetical protein